MNETCIFKNAITDYTEKRGEEGGGKGGGGTEKRGGKESSRECGEFHFLRTKQ